jgi:hypothetical protein
LENTPQVIVGLKPDSAPAKGFRESERKDGRAYKKNGLTGWNRSARG